MGIKQIFIKFFQWNEAFCRWIDPHLPQFNERMEYDEAVASFMNATAGLVVVDVGAGGECPFAELRKPELHTQIIGIDMSADEMKDNADLDLKLVADLSKALPLGDQQVDLIVSRSVLEHLTDQNRFVNEAKRVLKTKGLFIHLYPCKYAPFAILNRLLPRKLTRKLLHDLVPESRGISGYPAFYDRCSYSAMKSLLQKNGFEILRFRFGYYQSAYYRFFFPFYLLSILYELIIRALHVKNLSAQILVVARKR